MPASSESAINDRTRSEQTACLSAWSTSRGKRLFDIAFGSIGLLLAGPAMAVIAIAIKSASDGPILFRQTRVGLNETSFELLKFRTMRELPGTPVTRKGDSRITWIGKTLRHTKLDELPQLVNVIRGDMSLVGPRPDLPQFWFTLSGRLRRIMGLRPGVTGIASLRFRNEESLLAAVAEDRLHDYYVSTLLIEKVGMDLDYAERATFITDLRILLATIARVCR